MSRQEIELSLTSCQHLINDPAYHSKTSYLDQMALAEQTKKGGPYNKSDQESRRNEVHRLHFEYGYSARKIAEMMKINRNTINSDIKHLYSNIKEEMKQESENYILRQIGRLEAQRTRIIETITNNKTDDSIKFEKLLLDIDAKINNMLLRINSSQKTTEEQEIQEDEIRDFVLFLLIKHSKEPSLRKEEIISEIINRHHCTTTQAEKIFSQIMELGLESCKKFRIHEFLYDLLEFAFLRKYIQPRDGFESKIKTLCIAHNYSEVEIREIEEQYEKEHGSKDKWSDEIFEKYDNAKRQISEKHVKVSSDTIVEALESLSNQKRIDEDVKFLNIFFGRDEEKTLFEKMLFEKTFG